MRLPNVRAVSSARLESENGLFLLSANTASRRQSLGPLGRRLASDANWSRLAGTLRARKLLPSLGPRIVELAGSLASQDFRDEVEQAIITARRHGAFLSLFSSRMIGMLAEEGIRSAALKGPLLGEGIYGDAGRRLSTDVDLLVAPERLRDAVDVIRQLGYVAPRDYVDAEGLPVMHFVLLPDSLELPAVELHWRTHWYERHFACEQLLPPEPETRRHLAPSARFRVSCPPAVLCP